MSENGSRYLSVQKYTEAFNKKYPNSNMQQANIQQVQFVTTRVMPLP
jgi:hypothetical protein